MFLSLRNCNTNVWMWAVAAAVYVKNHQPALLSLSGRSNTETRTSSRIPIAALTSRVCAFGAAGLRRSLQGSFTWVRGIGLHVWLLIVMVRIWKNPVLLYSSAGHHFRACSWMLGLRLRLNPPFSRFFFFTQRSRADESLEKAIWELEKNTPVSYGRGRLAARFSVVRRAYRDAAQRQKERNAGWWSSQRGKIRNLCRWRMI